MIILLREARIMIKNPANVNKKLVIGFLLFFFLISCPFCSSYNMLNLIIEPTIITYERNDCPINLTVYEAWELLNETSNGIQIPIDLRNEDAWNESFIDTPWPEHPRWIGHIENIMEEMN